MASSVRLQKEETIAKVEKVIEDIVENLYQGNQVGIPLKHRAWPSTVCAQPPKDDSSTITEVHFPARTPQEARRFSMKSWLDAFQGL